jgi:malate dehydrogenase
MGRPRVGIVGGGNVGASAALLIARAELADVVISDIVEDMPQGKALDLTQMMAAQAAEARIEGTNRVADLADCAIVVVTAGVPRKPGMTREQLLDINAKIIRDCVGPLTAARTPPILIVVTNPLDVMTWLALKLSGWGRRRVFGMAGVLDSARMAAFVAMKLGVSMRDVRAMVLGSHGDSMVGIPRYTTVSGIPITELMTPKEIAEIVERTRNGGAEIVKLLKTGSAFYAPGASIAEMVGSILRDEKRILPTAVLLDGEYGMKDVVVGVPALLGAGGVDKVLEVRLEADEAAALKKSADIVRENCAVLKI